MRDSAALIAVRGLSTRISPTGKCARCPARPSGCRMASSSPSPIRGGGCCPRRCARAVGEAPGTRPRAGLQLFDLSGFRGGYRKGVGRDAPLRSRHGGSQLHSPSCRCLSGGGTDMDIAKWLNAIGLGLYETVFREHEIDANVLPDPTEADLEKIGVPPRVAQATAAGDRQTRLDCARLPPPPTPRDHLCRSPPAPTPNGARSAPSTQARVRHRAAGRAKRAPRRCAARGLPGS